MPLEMRDERTLQKLPSASLLIAHKKNAHQPAPSPRGIICSCLLAKVNSPEAQEVRFWRIFATLRTSIGP
jgi:hypothetical protein